LKGLIWLWEVSSVKGRVGKIIMNYQIPLKKKRECYYHLLKEECTVWPVGSKAKIIPLHAWTGPFGSRRLRSQDF
jgi:hypothetical protein